MPNLSSFEKVISKLRILANTPEKKALIEKAEPSLKRVLSPWIYEGDLATEGPKNMWLHGSFNYKDNPKDLDIIAKFPHLWGEGKALQKRPEFDPYFFSPTQQIPDKEMLKEAVQTGKERYGKDYKWTKLLGLGAGLGIADQTINPQEADAMPIGNILKGAKALSATKSAVSSASKALVGRTLEGEAVKGLKMEGKSILSVTKGSGTWRNVNFDDGTSLPVTTDILQSIMRETGTQQKMFELGQQDAKGKYEQAKRSLDMHLKFPRGTKKDAVGFRQQHRDQVRQVLDEPTTKTVGAWYGKKYVTLPEEYAKILERNGDITIDKLKTGVIE